MPCVIVLYFGVLFTMFMYSISLFRSPAVCLLIYTCVLTACHSVPRGFDAVSTGPKQAMPAANVTHIVDTAASYIRWTGTRPGKSHYGTLHFASGRITVKDNNITGGIFEIAVNSFMPEDQRRKGNELLRHHLLGEDFFEAGKFPVILFELSEVSKKQPGASWPGSYAVAGNLMLRNVVRNIIIPAEIYIRNNELTASADFNFDRTDWGLNYGNDRSLGNWFIRPLVRISLHLVAKKI